ncbi:MAG: tetratricopeptide repeat protein [Rhodospirillaceae bacterium]|nr:tetratricopeptide repeat protein [Rhodospirillaceae bacterium]MBT4940204.1 tetratricopeptide repeat protein [Rhodospirillaceae bacterium]
MSDLEHIIETALSHQRSGRLPEAAEIYRKVLAIDPGQPDAVHLLGMISHAEGNYSKAIELIGKAILLNANVSDYHLNIASAYLAIGDVQQAKSHAHKAIKLEPNSSEAHYNLGNACFAEGDADQACQAFKQALELVPYSQTIWANYLFALNFSSDATPGEIYNANRKWGTLLEGSVEKAPPFANDLSLERPLKLAYFLPELDLHVTTRFLAPILAQYDTAKFEVFGYGYRSDDGAPPSAISETLDHWVDVRGKGAAEIAESMRRDEIDILAHPCTFKSRYRDILAHRAAPIQIACTNLVSTTGLQAADYLITDDFISPPGSDDAHYTENLIRLSGFNTYQQFDQGPEVSALPALANGFVTFGSCNNIAKLSSEVIAAWSEILGGVSGSRLLLKHRAFENAGLRGQISVAFAGQGITEERLIFEGFTPDPAAYLSVYDTIDIALDPFPFGGGTVSYEALWMGVPVLTLAGNVFMGRLTGSLMHRLGLDEWVTSSVSDYKAAALRLASDQAALSSLRQDLRGRAQGSIFDAGAHVHELEAAFIEAWQKYCLENKGG